jgi:hypothetical protein
LGVRTLNEILTLNAAAVIERERKKTRDLPRKQRVTPASIARQMAEFMGVPESSVARQLRYLLRAEPLRRWNADYIESFCRATNVSAADMVTAAAMQRQRRL